MELLSGFILGIAGSFHCVGMCGPIVLSLPSGNPRSTSFVIGRVLYNSGRIITYTFLGTLFGLLGNRIFLFGFQQGLSVFTGIVILVTVFFTIKGKNIFTGIPFINSAFVKFKIAFSKIYKVKSKSAMLMTGILNGFLPCGFVYIGLSGAMLTGVAFDGALYMLLFGLGTVPLMLGLSFFSNFINIKLRKRITKLIPAFTVILALLFIARGLNLGIPYISPKYENTKTDQGDLQCH
ncbi:MAG: sulfite exporter TauE/SafE family protein [Ignavibacteria bacterium]|nr:sulfite exporter TauE/SafE family protein [Ignavibacteria bacterium]